MKLVANQKAIGILLTLCPSFERAQEILELGQKRELQSEYWQGVYDSFIAVNEYFNREE